MIKQHPMAGRSLPQPITYKATSGGNAISSQSPVGPSGPLRQVYPVLPLLGPPVFSLKRNTRYGRGIVVPVTGAAASPITVTHNLGRVPQGALAFVNNGGAAQNPNITLGTPTRNQATISGDQAMTNCLVWFF